MTSQTDDTAEPAAGEGDHLENASAALDAQPDPTAPGNGAAEPQHEAEVIDEDDPIDALLVGKPVDDEDPRPNEAQTSS